MDSQTSVQDLSHKRDVSWMFVVYNLYLYASFLCALHFIIFEAHWFTTVFALTLVFHGYIGVAAGSHRLWTHRSYNASSTLKVILMLGQTLAGIGSIYDWVRLHRLHHKYFNSELDPFCPRNGFVYAHFTSHCLDYSEAQIKALEEIDLSDLESDKVVMFQKRFYWILVMIFALLLPINAPVEYWGDSITSSVFIVGWFRYAIVVNLCWLITSAHCIWNLKPGDRYPSAKDNWLFLIHRTNWLDYHYLLPKDFKTSEFGSYGNDLITKCIQIFAILELASDLKTTTTDDIRSAVYKSVKNNVPIRSCLSEVMEVDTMPAIYG